MRPRPLLSIRQPRLRIDIQTHTQALAEATTLTFQFHPSGGASGSPTTITVPGVDRLGESAHALAARLWQQHNVPAPQR